MYDGLTCNRHETRGHMEGSSPDSDQGHTPPGRHNTRPVGLHSHSPTWVLLLPPQPPPLLSPVGQERSKTKMAVLHPSGLSIEALLLRSCESEVDWKQKSFQRTISAGEMPVMK